MKQRTHMRILVLVSIVFVVPSTQALHAQPVEPSPINDAETASYIRSALPLDEPRHLCIDLPGHGAQSNPDAPFTVHTCKDGMWNLDQRFRWTADGSGLEMPQYGECLAAAEASAKAALVLSDCSAENSKFLSQQARLKLKSDPSLCITIAEGTSELTAGGEKFPERYRARAVSLELCAETAIERQLWSVIQPLDLETPLLPPRGSLPVEQ